MKCILHVGSYDFDFKDNTGTASLIAEILTNNYVKGRFYDSIDVTLEFKKDKEEENPEFVDDVSEALGEEDE